MKHASHALLLAAFVWGLSVPLATAVLHHLSAADLVLVENVSGTVIVGAAALAARRSLAGPWRPAIVLGSLEPGRGDATGLGERLHRRAGLAVPT
jgi:hypothetical protein